MAAYRRGDAFSAQLVRVGEPGNQVDLVAPHPVMPDDDDENGARYDLMNVSWIGRSGVAMWSVLGSGSPVPAELVTSRGWRLGSARAGLLLRSCGGLCRDGFRAGRAPAAAA